MQGLPTHLTKIASAKAGKVENSPLKGLVGESAGEAQETGSTPAAKGDFSSLFANMLGGDSANTTPVVDGKTKEKEKSQVDANTTSVDVLLNVKGQEQNKKQENAPLKTEVAMPADVLKNIDNLLDKTPVDGKQVVGEKVAKTSGSIEQLLNALKGTEDSAVEGESENTQLPVNEKTQNLKGAKNQSPLDFLLKETKTPNVGMETSPEAMKLINTGAEEKVSKLGLSSEDFIKNAEAAKTAPGETFDPKLVVQNHMNQSMKAYGQKQGLLNNNLIKNTKDLAFNDQKSKSSIDELKSPDLKIGADLSSVKESFIPLMNKQETSQNLQTAAQPKVLDLSKINTANTNEIIKRISDYVEQSQVASKDSLDLTVRHDSLGQFNIQVNRSQGAGNQMMDMQITTNSAEGHEFFMKHEVGLMKNLSQAGIQLSDLRIVSGGEAMNFSQSDSRQSGNSQYNGDNAPREFMSFDSGDSSNGSQRRKALWEQAQQNQQRYGA